MSGKEQKDHLISFFTISEKFAYLQFLRCRKKTFLAKGRNTIIKNKKMKSNSTVNTQGVFDEPADKNTLGSNKLDNQISFEIKTDFTTTPKTKIFALTASSSKKLPPVFFNTCFDKNHLKTMIAWFLEQYGEKRTVDLVETLKEVGFQQATRAGVSLGVDDLQIPPQKATFLSQASVKMEDVTNAIQAGNLTSVEKSQRLIDTWNQTSETLRQTAVHHFRTTNPVNPVYMMAFSGARGNISQVRQLVAMRGLMADPQGAILEFPIQSNFREGLTVTEYLISCYGARKGLVDTALRTATSGYLTRRLVDAVQHVVVLVADCDTKKGIVIKDKNIEQRLAGRVLLEDLILDSTTVIKKNTLISPRLAQKIALKNKEIRVRSPLTCETEKSVCQFCYGIDLAKGKLVSIGEAVGIIAAQSIGEPGTQLTMRTFHTGGVGVFSDQAMKSFNAPFDGQIQFLEPLAGLFVRTPHGNIVYLLKHQNTKPTKLLLRLTPKCILGKASSTQKSNVYEITHDDVPAGSLLWVKQGEFVKTGQLLIQASRLQTATQEMPESSHPVQAPLSGEVFFQSMAIRIIEEEKRTTSKSKKKKQQNRLVTQINQKEISPTFPTLVELGNFWVFSTFVQTKSRFSTSFFLKGDFLSPETPIQQYNLHLREKGQLKRVDSSLIFGNNSLEFGFSKIQFSGLVYFLFNTREKKKYNILSYTNNSKDTLLNWYPSLKSFPTHLSGYCSILESDTDFSSNKASDVPPKFILEKDLTKNGFLQKQDHAKFNNSNFVWCPERLFTLKTIPHKNKFLLEDSQKNKLFSSSCFLVNQGLKTLSKKGIFQIEYQPGFAWCTKFHFMAPFVKNLFGNPAPKLVNFGKTSKTEFADKYESLFQNTFLKPQDSVFVNKALTVSHTTLYHQPQINLIEKKQGWFYVSEKHVGQRVDSQLPGIVLEPIKKIEGLRFGHSYISANLIHRQSLVVLKSKNEKNTSDFFYSLQDLLNLKKEFSLNFRQNQGLFNKKLAEDAQRTNFPRKFSTKFCFYKKFGIGVSLQNCSILGQNAFSRGIQKMDFLNSAKETESVKFNLKRKRRLSHILFLQKNYHQILPNKQFLKNNWLLQKNRSLNNSLQSPLFTKQYQTSFEQQKNITPSLNVVTLVNSGWASLPTFLKIEFKFNSQKTFSRLEQVKQKLIFPKSQIWSSQNLWPSNAVEGRKVLTSTDYKEVDVIGFSLMFYQAVKLQNSNQFCFQTFKNGWILPEFSMTEAFLKSTKLGEFGRVQKKENENSFNLLRNQDLITLKLPAGKDPIYLIMGTKVRWGQELIPGFASPVSGQVIKKTSTTVTLQKGVPLLASIRGLVHVSHNDLIQKNDLLITLRSRRLQTEDIVQGIPKIEQLFEARETQGGEIIQNNMHTLLKTFFNRALLVKPVQEAVQVSLTYIQKFLVENILEAYSNQGVHIAEKHVEVVVRQMTARVRITHGGDTGFLPGEFVQLRWIEKVNLRFAQVNRRQAQYEPIILGITKSVLQSESFLLAASFQQVSKVLVRSALAKKTDFLRGLHENILVGQPIPAGTGIVGFLDSTETSVESIGYPDISASSQFESGSFDLNSSQIKSS